MPAESCAKPRSAALSTAAASGSFRCAIQSWNTRTDPPRLLSREQRQHAGMRVETVVADLAVGEEADQRERAEMRGDAAGLRGVRTEQIGAARQARDVDPTPDRLVDPLLQL